jgi:PhzF family phenazine biosynthesis protein
MTMQRRFSQIDVFTDEALFGNPVAVVHDAEGIDDETMRRFARWTNLSETTFLLAPTDPAADYRVRIFTPTTELPFAGHPTLGTCRAWLDAGGVPARPDVVMQQCAAGMITVRRSEELLSFGAPPLIRSGPVDDALLDELTGQLGIDRAGVVDAAWADNGPGWVALLLRDAEAVLAVQPGTVTHDIGVVGRHAPGGPVDVELRAFFPVRGATIEDPVTGSLNASVAQWLLGAGVLTAPYVAAQGTVLGCAGRVHVSSDDAGIWVGGRTVSVVSGTVDIG